MIKTAALVAFLGLSGCSLIGVRSEPTRPWLSDGPAECNGYGLPVLDTLGAAITLGVGTVTTVAASRGQTFGDNPLDGGRNAVIGVSVTALAIGLGYALSAARGYHLVAACRSASLRLEQRRFATSHPVLLDSIEAARKAAALGDCATVAKLDLQVRALVDADYHDTVFVRDVAIARCLAGNAPAAPAAPAPSPEPP